MNINRKRIASEADEAAGVGKVFDTDIFNGSAKGGERRVHRLGVGRIRFYEYVQILGGAGLGVKRDGITTDDKVLNAVGVEGGQEVLEVLVHPGPYLSARTP